MAGTPTGYRVYSIPDLNNFRTFYDFTWTREFYPQIENSVIEEDFMNLIGHWLKISEAYRIPEVMMAIIKQQRQEVKDGFANDKRKLMSWISDRLMKGLGNRLSNMRKQELAGILLRCESELEVLPDDFDMGLGFYNLVTSEEWSFGIGISSLVTSTFIGIYFAYELFAKRCWHILGGKPREKVAWHTIFEEVIGDTAKYKEVWDCPEVNEARKARDAIVHTDGKTAEKNPIEYKPYYIFDGNLIMVRAEGVKHVYENLKARVEVLCRIVLAKFPKP